MSEHTPGPWKAEYRYDRIEPGSRRKTTRISVGQPINPESESFEQTVCWIIPHVFGYAAPHAANARLIAAAPDLLEACKSLVLRYEHLAARYGHLDDDDDPIREGKDAIAKVEGR